LIVLDRCAQELASVLLCDESVDPHGACVPMLRKKGEDSMHISILCRFIQAFLLVLVGSSLLFSQNPPHVSDSPALALSSLATAAMAGKTVEDLTLTGTATRVAGSEKETGPATLKAMASGETSMDVAFPSGRRTEVYALSPRGPQGAWTGPDGKPHPVSFHNLLVDPGWFAPLLTLQRINSQAQGVTVSFSGNVDRNGQSLNGLHGTLPVPGPDASRHPAWMLTLLQQASQFDLYIDSATMLPAEMAFNGHPDNDVRRDLPVRVRYSEYRAVNGIQVPFRIRKYVNNSLILDVKIETAVFNTGLSASEFSVQ